MQGRNDLNYRSTIKFYGKYGNCDAYHRRSNQICERYNDLQIKGDMLEINCGMGATLMYLKSRYPQYEFDGIERKDFMGKFCNLVKTVNLAAYTNIQEFPFWNKKYDFITLDTRTIELHELDTYIEFMKEHLKPTGKMFFQTDNIQFYKYWGKLLFEGINDENLNPERITLKHVENKIPDHGCHPEIWFFYFAKEVDGDHKEEIQKVIDTMSTEQRNKVMAISHGLIVGK